MSKKKIGIIAGASVVGLVAVLVIVLWVTGVFGGSTIRNGTYTLHNITVGGNTVNASALPEFPPMPTDPTDIGAMLAWMQAMEELEDDMLEALEALDLTAEEKMIILVVVMLMGDMEIRVSGDQLTMSIMGEERTVRHRVASNNNIEVYATQAMVNSEDYDFEKTGWQAMDIDGASLRYVDGRIVIEAPLGEGEDARIVTLRFSR
ncbi:MAG: hypothetical protein FWE16_00060 [Firmicutes bacterium]|nr:hypothetical protein [Bacillota bacterium]